MTSLRQARWVTGAIAACVLFMLFPLMSTRFQREYAATVQLQLEFVLTNGGRLNVDQFCTNALNQRICYTERLYCTSETFRDKAMSRLTTGSLNTQPTAGYQISGANTSGHNRDAVTSWAVPVGMRVRAYSPTADGATALASAMAETYREERNKLWPAPPGCQSLAITIAKPAKLEGQPRYNAFLLRAALAAILFGVSIALRFPKGSVAKQIQFWPVFLTWFSFLLALGLLIPELDVAIALAGAIFLALLLTTAAGFTAWTVSQNVPISPKFLNYTLAVTCLCLVGFGLFSLMFEKVTARTTARLRIAVQKPDSNEELPIAYDSRFLKSQEALMNSGFLSGRVVDTLGVKAFGDDFDSSLNRQEASFLAKHFTKAKAVENTSLIDVDYHKSSRRPGGITASQIALIFRDYCRDRSKINQTEQLQVAVVDSAPSRSGNARWLIGRYCQTLSENIDVALLVLVGAICTALLARKPIQLYVLPFGAALYFTVLLLACLATGLAPVTYTAASLVRVWLPAGSEGSDQTESMLDQECQLAVSDEALARTLGTLEATPGFPNAERQRWRAMSRPEKHHWLKERLQVWSLKDPLLMTFAARAENREDAAEISNAAAAAYCALRLKSSEQTKSKPSPPNVEIIEPAVPALRAENSMNPIAQALVNGSGTVGWFLGGTGIGFMGLLLEKIRRIKQGNAA